MASSNFVVIYDACVLYPAPLRDLLMHLASWSRLFQAKWTEDIHREWINSLLRNRSDLKREDLERTRQCMDKAVPDALVEQSRYQQIVPGLSLPDPNDRHVLAAAIACGAQTIVTFNLKDFPAAILKSHHIKAIHPDLFLKSLLDLDEAAVVDALKRQAATLKNPPKTVHEILEILKKSVPEFCERVAPILESYGIENDH